MDKWIDIASKFGIPVGLLLLLGYFLLRHVWPFVTKQIEDSKAERKAEMESAKAERKEEIGKFINTMDGYRKVLGEMSETQRSIAKTLDAMVKGTRGK